MKIGNIDFVAWDELSDAFDNLATLISHTYNYDGRLNGVLSVRYGDNDEFDMTVEDYNELEKKHPNWSANEIINCFYQNICDEKDLMLVTYDQLEQLELLKKKNDRNKNKVNMLERKWVVGKCLKAKNKE